MSRQPPAGNPGEDEHYADQMRLETLLDLQHSFAKDGSPPLHDELLFVIIHQVAELWLKLLLHETRLARTQVRGGLVAETPKVLTRMRRILEQMNHGWDVLTTLTPVDYMTFRHRLGSASGFQSFQYRAFEFLLGGKDAAMLAAHKDRPETHAQLAAVMAEPSFYDEVLALLARRGLGVPKARLERDWRKPYRPHAGVRRAWAAIYRDPQAHWDLYELAEKMVDFEHMMDIWRHHHASTVERVIGFKPGTGGSAGVAYLRKAVFRRFFPELWACRTDL